MEKENLSYFPIGEILQAPENSLLYDGFRPHCDDDDFQLYMSIKKNGIREPLHVSADGVLLSGHRRYAAARQLGLASVPCIKESDVVFDDLSDYERLRLLSDFNKQRDKSHGERMREALLEVDPDEAYQTLLADRLERQRADVELADNITLGGPKKRAKITTHKFLAAAKEVIHAEKEYWPLTVRRVHYLLLNNPPLRHDKKPHSTYKNDLSSYKALSGLLSRARLAGLIPFEAIEDETRPIRVLATYQHPADYIKDEMQDFLRYYARDLLRGQRNHIEILVEKNAIRKHVECVADEYCIPCTTGRGYASLTPRQKMVRRFRRSGRERLVLLILSDFDPDGEEIAASFSRSLRDDFGISNLTAYKVALTGDDVRAYNLPSDLQAKKKSPNYKKFVERHGVHVAELDAAPVALLQDKLREAIESCLDMELFQREVEAEKEDVAFIAATKRLVVQSMGEMSGR